MDKVDSFRVIDDVATLRALADPMRMRILDLAMAEPERAWTARDLAARIDIAPTSIYYHLNLLERHGLLKVRHTRLVNGIVEKQYGAAQRELTFHHRVDAPADEARALTSTVLDQLRADVDGGLRTGAMSIDADAPAQRLLVISQASALLSAERAEEFQRELTDLVRRFADAGTPSGHRFTIVIAMHPEV